MITKLFEISSLPSLCKSVTPQPKLSTILMRRAGYNLTDPPFCVILCRLEASGCDRNATYDPYSWPGGARTMPGTGKSPRSGKSASPRGVMETEEELILAPKIREWRTEPVRDPGEPWDHYLIRRIYWQKIIRTRSKLTPFLRFDRPFAEMLIGSPRL